jgi:ubiquinone/menaquinone biosynthesis C-methylase UbiE
MKNIKPYTEDTHAERMSNALFRYMDLTFIYTDLFHPYIDERVKDFGIEEGMTVVDYGCGTGRYTIRFAKMVGSKGLVYAADIHELAVRKIKRIKARRKLDNVIPILVNGYHSEIPDQVADVICAIDMFFAIQQPTPLLAELRRICKPQGVLLIDDGHQPRDETKKKLLASGHWTICEESEDHLKCNPA